MDAKYGSHIAQATSSFNPRARDGRETSDEHFALLGIVSIHAPVMDAKTTRTWALFTSRVSIHAPVMDANLTTSPLHLDLMFQSTRP